MLRIKIKERIKRRIFGFIKPMLDEYYCNLLTDTILDYLKHYCLDWKIEYTENEVYLMAKPKKYQNYTRIEWWIKTESLEKLIQIEKGFTIENIEDTIKYLIKNDKWE